MSHYIKQDPTATAGNSLAMQENEFRSMSSTTFVILQHERNDCCQHHTCGEFDGVGRGRVEKRCWGSYSRSRRPRCLSGCLDRSGKDAGRAIRCFSRSRIRRLLLNIGKGSVFVTNLHEVSTIDPGTIHIVKDDGPIPKERRRPATSREEEVCVLDYICLARSDPDRTMLSAQVSHLAAFRSIDIAWWSLPSFIRIKVWPSSIAITIVWDRCLVDVIF